MKRKSLLFLLLMAVFAPWAAQAQTVTVCDGTAGSNAVPFCGYYVDTQGCTCEFILPSTTEGMSSMSGKDITAMTFYLKNQASAAWGATFNVYLKEVDYTTLTGTVGPGSCTIVKTGVLNANAATINITFDDAFSYHGGHLLIGTYVSTKGSWKDATFYGINDAPSGSSYTSGASSSYNGAHTFLPKTTFTYETPTAFPSPKNLQISDITAESATASWEAPTSATPTGYEYQYKFAETPSWPDTWNSINDTHKDLVNLFALKTYDFRVRANYAGGDSEPIEKQFTTKATPVAVGDQWNDDFEGESCSWELINGSLTNANWAWGTAVSNGGTHAIYVSNDGGQTNSYNSDGYAKVYATKLLTFADSKYTFQFDWKCVGETTYDYLRVGLVPATTTLTADAESAQNNPTGWIALHDTDKLSAQSTWTTSPEKTIQLEAGNYYLVLRWRQDSGTSNGVPAAVDNVSITRLLCPYDVAGLTHDPESVTAHSATVNWTDGDPGQWQVAWSKDSNFPAASTQTETVSAATINLINLDASSTYYVRVRAYCGGTDYGTWCDAISFNTSCEALASLNVNFDNYTGTSASYPANNLPPCWNYLNNCSSTNYQGYPVIYNNSSSSYSGNNHLRFYSYYYYPATEYAILPEIQNLNGKRVTFYARYNSTKTNLIVGVMTDFNNASSFQEVETIDDLTTSYKKYTVNFNEVTGNYIAFKMVGTSSYSYYIYVDDIVVQQQPDCATPEGLAVTANSQTPEGATITWTAGDATSWIVEYKKSTEENYTAIAEPVNAATYTFTGLDASTTYNVRVKVNCTAGAGVTYPTDPVSFITEATCPAPKNLVVSNITATQATLTWTPGYDETEWTVKYKKHTDTDYITAPAVSGTPTCNLSPLTGGTVYDVQIIGCDDTHIYTVSSAFTTAFGVPFNETFTTPNTIPTGWENKIGLLSSVMAGEALTTGSQWSFITSNNVFDNHARINIYGCADSNNERKGWLITPSIVMGANQSLSFDLALTAYSGNNAAPATTGTDDRFIVLITTNNGATWSILRQWDNAGSTYVYNSIPYTTDGEEVYIDLASYNGQIVRIAFYGESTVCNADNNLHIDNVSIDNTPTCFRPTAVTASNVTNHSATISWTPGEAGQTAWQIAYKKGETFDPTDPALDWTTITMVDVTENPTYTFDKVFDAASNYYFYVRANCGTTAEPDYSAWSKKVCVIATEAAAPAPTTFAKTNVGPDYVDLYWNKPAGDYLSGYGIYYSTSSTTPTAETEAIETITVIEAPTAEAPYTLSGLTANTTYYFWIRANHEANVYSSWKAISGTYFTTPEACPKPTSLAASEPSPTSIKLSWTAGATWQTSWVIAYSKTQGFDPTDSDACTYVDAPTNPFVVEGLDSEETYYFRVKGDCGSTYGESEWNLTEASETTLMACPVPEDLLASNLTQNTADLTWTGYSDNYNIRYRVLTPAAEAQTTTEDFSSYTATSYSQEGSLPEGWKGYSSYTYTGYKPHVSNNSALGSSYDLEGFAGGATSTDNFLYMIGNSTYPYSSYTILPQISDLEAFSFDYGFENASNGTLTVGYCTDNTSGSTFTAFNDLTITGSTTSVTVSLTAADIATLNSNNGYLTFKWYYSSSYGVGIDNVAITTRTYTPGEWIDPVLTSNTEAISLDELTAGTKYEVQVQAVCDPTSSEWSESLKFTTLAEGTKVFTNAAGDCMWSTAGNWVPSGVPSIGDNAILRANANIESGYVAEANKITFEGSETPYLNIVADGQLKTNNAVTAKMHKLVNPYEGDKDNYYLIASPINGSIYPSNVYLLLTTMFITTQPDLNYDLYSFDQSQDNEWRNYEASPKPFSTLDNGKGYLYAHNYANGTLNLGFEGELVPSGEDKVVNLTYIANKEFSGWNLVGNPFPCNAYVKDATGNIAAYYKMNSDGNGFEAATGNFAVAPIEGIFVKATAADQSFSFSRTAPVTSPGQGNLHINLTEVVTTRNEQPATDNAIIRFDGGSTLEKFSFRQGSTKVFITEEGKDYAVVSAGHVGEIPVSFKAETSGNYTLSFTSQEVSFSYLHLIDNLTGNDVNLLETPSYSFNAQVTDYAQRFRLVFAIGSSVDGDSFGFVNGSGNLCIYGIEGEATIQVIDILGHVITSDTFSGSYERKLNVAPGVYMIRLINGNDVKVQKIVVR